MHADGYDENKDNDEHTEGNDDDDDNDSEDKEKLALEIVARFPWIADCTRHDINHCKSSSSCVFCDN